MNKIEKCLDSYEHYRHHVGLNPVHALWRSFAYEFLHWSDGRYRW